jgi:hypothetical protein
MEELIVVQKIWWVAHYNKNEKAAKKFSFDHGGAHLGGSRMTESEARLIIFFMNDYGYVYTAPIASADRRRTSRATSKTNWTNKMSHSFVYVLYIYMCAYIYMITTVRTSMDYIWSHYVHTELVTLLARSCMFRYIVLSCLLAIGS